MAGGIGSQTAGATELCAAVNLLNYAAGNVGQTVRFGADLDHGDGYGALEALSKSLSTGEIQVLLVHEANPVFTAAARDQVRRGVREGAVQGLHRAVLRRDGRGVRPAAPEPPRARALGRPQRPRRRTGA